MHPICQIAAALGLALAMPAAAQTAQAPAQQSAAAGSVAEQPPADLKFPELAFTPTPADEADYDKFFYFHRVDTSYAQALADIRECDALASGSNIFLGDTTATSYLATQYGIGGAIGSAIGAAMADAIFGSAQRRKQHRESVRNCMGFKQYQRYGLSHALWARFNFEEGNGRKHETERNTDLALQAMAASGPKPATKELGL